MVDKRTETPVFTRSSPPPELDSGPEVRIADVLAITKLSNVFDTFDSESAALGRADI
jgi:hypothetical protein